MPLTTSNIVTSGWKGQIRKTQVLTLISQGDWINVLVIFMKLKPLVCKGEADRVTTIHQKEGVKCVTLSLGDDLV